MNDQGRGQAQAPASFQGHQNGQSRTLLEATAIASPLPMLRQLGGDAAAAFCGKLFDQSPRRRDVTSGELASADHPRFWCLRPSAIHSCPTLNRVRKWRKWKMSL